MLSTTSLKRRVYEKRQLFEEYAYIKAGIDDEGLTVNYRLASIPL